MEMAELSGTTRHALKEAVLSPRFYTTDFEEVDAMDYEHMRTEMEWVCGEFARDYNKNHFKRNEEFQADFDDMPVRDLFIEFLERSCTAEFSGCLLYAEMVRNLKDPTLRNIFQYMSRDEGRHAGFLNKTMGDLAVAIDLSVLQTRKKYTFFKPKFIYYATYLSEKIGYSRYINIYNHLQQNPDGTIHPIFKWFKEWCNDEYRHGEFFAILMRSQPKLLQGTNRLWIRFFQLAVYATMYLNDARRADFYAALGLDWREYDQKVIHLCNSITTQVFPVTMPVDNPKFFEHLDACVELDRKAQALSGRKDPISLVRVAGLRIALASHLVRTYFMKPRPTTEANRWRGLEGFPNFSESAAVAAAD
ncbi:MAG: magnesium-protoporphyrin IX monomethyl ester (oxidative) cyclase [Caldilineaceae bacterium]|nr:magnesium-protoporphyrin IX monomethyl ester (oxidative) cyclase [Caldilineaceae bacterium]